MTSIDSQAALRTAKLSMPDLSPRPHCALEWWFVHGFIESRSLGRRDFMLSAFCQHGAGRTADGHMLLVSSFDPGSKDHKAECRITPALVDHFVSETPNELADIAIDRTVLDALIHEVAANGPPRPVIRDETAVALKDAPFALGWGDMRMHQREDSIELAVTLPGGGPVCQLTAHPEASWFEGREVGGAGTGKMAYDCCPRLRLFGTADGDAVAGEAWIDHQWGGYGWLRGENGGAAMLGWDWLGINLDDGRDVMVMVQREMESGQPVAASAVLFDPMHPPRQVDGVAIAPLRSWTNPATLVAYPVECAITIPALAAEFRFSPLLDDQEVPVFGLMSDAIWEGVGRISGHIGGDAVVGRGRMELNGYGAITDFTVFQKKWVDRIDGILTNFLPKTLGQAKLADYLGPPRWAYDEEAQTAMVSKPVWDLLSRGGKHWRPIFGFLLLDALGVDARPYETMFSAIPELVHNGSVIVDDIEDASLTRRGEETIHRRYGLPTAINAGNTLYFLPLLTIADNPELTLEQRDAIYRVVLAMFVQAHFGQAQDLYWSKQGPDAVAKIFDDPATGDVILQAHAFKSAAAVRAIAEISCIIAKTDDATRAACCRLAESWGVAFQMTDDVNNFTTEPGWGKVRGEDVAEGKFSYAIHKAVSLLSGPDRDRLLALLATEELRRSSDGLAEAIGLIEGSGALKACREEAIDLVRQDWPAFSHALPSSRAKIMLRALLEKLLGTPFEM